MYLHCKIGRTKQQDVHDTWIIYVHTSIQYGEKTLQYMLQMQLSGELFKVLFWLQGEYRTLYYYHSTMHCLAS